MTDLIIDDTENIIDFLTYTKDGIIMTHLILIQKNYSQIKRSGSAISKSVAFYI